MTSTKKKQHFICQFENQLCKNILVVFCLFFIFKKAYTQVPESNLDEMLIDVDKTTFTSGILYNKVTPIADLSNFNMKNRNVSSKKHFEQALYELYRASNKEKFVSYKELRKKYILNERKVNIGIINASFQELNYNHNNENKGALTLKNNKFKKINDSPTFKDAHALIIAPLNNYLVGKTINFIFDENFMFEETYNKKITSLVADFGTNKKYTIYKNEAFVTKDIEISYNESGYKTLVFTAAFQDGTTKTTKGKLHVKVLSRNLSRMMDDSLVEDFTITSTIPFQGYDETSPIYGELEYRVFYHTNNSNYQKTLLKPIIIIDGFDPEDKRKMQDDDSPKPANEHHSIEEMMVYYKNKNKVEIIPLLRGLGYDVVIVNQPSYIRGDKTIDGGADYIERNALTHVTLYQHLNNTLFSNGSSEELVIVGPSMGGQMSRYALAYMEKHNIPHNTRLWVSIDSPHLGANIPIGMQSMMNLLDAFGGSVAAADFYHNQLKSTAGNQQLIAQHLEYHLPDYLNRGSPIHQQYYSNLTNNGLPNSNGYPQNLRKIAIVNGSIVGNANGVTGEEDFRIHGFVEQLLWNTKVIEMNTKYMGNTGSITQAARLWRLSQPLRTATYTNINPNGSMDVVPGGQFNSEDQLHSAILGQSVGVSDWGNGLNFEELALAMFLGVTGDHFESRTNKKIHSFIPTVSALGFYNSNFDWGSNINRNLVCSNEIPFNSYYAPIANEQHTSFTEKSVNWLLKELSGNYQAPTVYMSVEDLKGSNTLSIDQSGFYYFENCKISDSAIWQVSSNLQIVSSTNTSVIVRAINNSINEEAHIMAQVDGQTITKKIWVGKPSITTTQDALVNYVTVYLIGANQTNIYDQGITSTIWENISSAGGCSVSFSGSDFEGFGHGNCTNWSVYVKISATNSCGTTTIYRNITPPDPGPCDTSYRFSNNPMQTENGGVNKIIIEPCEGDYRKSSSTKSKNYTITIYNAMGGKVYAKTQREKEFDISTLKKGFYITRFQTVSGKIIVKKLVIE
jgi:pimeloyl-ACP methyl ester carboxylesterase